MNVSTATLSNVFLVNFGGSAEPNFSIRWYAVICGLSYLAGTTRLPGNAG